MNSEFIASLSKIMWYALGIFSKRILHGLLFPTIRFKRYELCQIVFVSESQSGLVEGFKILAHNKFWIDFADFVFIPV